MSTEHATAKAAAHSKQDHGLSEKGLKAGSVGLIGAVVIGVSCIAPAYTLTAALGPTVSEVGVHLPAIFRRSSVAYRSISRFVKAATQGCRS